MKRIFYAFSFILVSISITVSIVFIAREPLLRCLSKQLIQEDTLVACELIVVLSGHAEERAPEAARLLNEQKGPRILVTGSITPRIFKELNINITEADLTAKVLKRVGVDSSKIEILRAGTSTWEECNALNDYAHKQKIQSILLVSSLFHTRRMQWVVNRTLRKNGIRVVIHGAPPLAFRWDEWWNSEEGLLFVVNEYLKLLYYSYRYSE